MGMVRRWPWVVLGPGAEWPSGASGRDLRRRLHQVGNAIRHEVIVTSGQRGWLAQHDAYMDYLAGGTLAAPCCWKHYPHSKSECGRQCASMHCQGRAADCVLQLSSGKRVNIGEYGPARVAMARFGLSLPVGSGETWHVQVGNVWNS